MHLYRSWENCQRLYEQQWLTVLWHHRTQLDLTCICIDFAIWAALSWRVLFSKSKADWQLLVHLNFSPFLVRAVSSDATCESCGIICLDWLIPPINLNTGRTFVVVEKYLIYIYREAIFDFITFTWSLALQILVNSLCKVDNWSSMGPNPINKISVLYNLISSRSIKRE